MTDHANTSDHADELTRRLVDGIAEREALKARTDLLDKPAARAYLGVGTRQFDALVVAGAIPVTHRARGRKYLFDAEDLDAWVESQRVNPERPGEPRNIGLTAQDSSPLAEGRARSVKEVSLMPSTSSPAPARSPMLDRMLDRRQAATYCGVGLTTFDALVRSEKIPHLRIGRKHLFDPSDLDMALLTAKYNGSAER